MTSRSGRASGLYLAGVALLISMGCNRAPTHAIDLIGEREGIRICRDSFAQGRFECRYTRTHHRLWMMHDPNSGLETFLRYEDLTGSTAEPAYDSARARIEADLGPGTTCADNHLSWLIGTDVLHLILRSPDPAPADSSARLWTVATFGGRNSGGTCQPAG